MKIKNIAIEQSKTYETTNEALADLSFSRIGSAIVTTNDGHEVMDIYEKDEETVYILNIDDSNGRIHSVTYCTLEETSDYQLLEN